LSHSRRARDLQVEDLDVAFQPIVDLKWGETIAVEALVRCQWPEFKNPTILFQHAEQEKVCGPLGRKIRSVAFAACQKLPLFVNIHPQELNDQWLVRPDDPLFFHEGDVYLEITEAAAFQYFDLCMDVLKEVCSRSGAYLVIDDLGAGHSNLMRIVDLEPRIVKLDLTLARDIDKKPRQQALLRHLVALCSELEADVVVEGIESLDELLAIRDSGAKYAQGFFLARPAFPVPSVHWPLEPPAIARATVRHRPSRRQ
jgi:EAL domain-containing protein (putative c-di-GMP-specific phosphodiesterase class I)